MAREATTTARGYGADHQRRRRQLLPHYVGTPCPRCGVTMTADAMDLDHTIPLVIDPTSRGDRFVCAPCNRGPLAAAARHAKRQMTNGQSGEPPTTDGW